MQFDNQTTRNVADIVARILAGESAQQEPKMLEEELVGNQHKIDANKNNKIDAHDFKLLRKKKKVEEAEQIDELKKSTLGSYVKKASKDLANSSFEHGEDEHRQYGDPEDTERENEMKKRERDIENRQKGISRAATKLSKEETELTESHFKVGDEVICKASGMEGEVVKIDEPQTGKYYTVKQENGKMVKYAPNELKKEEEDDEDENKMKSEEVHNKKKDLPFTPDATKKPVKNSDGTIQKPMSLARELAKRGLKRAMSKEEVEQIDELSKDTLKSYAGKVIDKTRTMPQGEKKQKHLVGLVKSMDKMKKEETEIDEAMFPGTKEYEKKFGQSPQQKLKKKGDTVPTSQGDMTKTDKGVAHRRRFTEMIDSYAEGGLKYIATLVQEEPDNEEFTKEVEEVKRKATQKKSPEDEARVAKASVQAVKVEETEIQVINADIANGVQFDNIEEDIEQIDELSKDTYKSYLSKSEGEVKKALGRKQSGGREVGPNTSIPSSSRYAEPNTNRRGTNTNKAQIHAIKKLREEDVELDEREMTDAEMKKREDIVKGMKKGMAGFKQRYGDRAKEVMYATATKQAMKD